MFALGVLFYTTLCRLPINIFFMLVSAEEDTASGITPVSLVLQWNLSCFYFLVMFTDFVSTKNESLIWSIITSNKYKCTVSDAEFCLLPSCIIISS